MGNAVSEPVLQRHLVVLSDFAGDQKADQDNQVWRQLFAFPVSLSQLPPSQVEQHVAGCCDQLGMTGTYYVVCSLFDPHLCAVHFNRSCLCTL